MIGSTTADSIVALVGGVGIGIGLSLIVVALRSARRLDATRAAIAGDGEVLPDQVAGQEYGEKQRIATGKEDSDVDEVAAVENLGDDAQSDSERPEPASPASDNDETLTREPGYVGGSSGSVDDS